MCVRNAHSRICREKKEKEKKNVRKQKMWSIPQSIFKYLWKTSKFGSIFSLFISIPYPYTPYHMILITSVAGKIKLCLMFVRTRLYLHILFKCVWCVRVCLLVWNRLSPFLPQYLHFNSRSKNIFYTPVQNSHGYFESNSSYTLFWV